MGYATAHNELRNRFNSQWGVTTPIAWPNVKFDVPAPSTYWCRFAISDFTGNEGTQNSIGGITNNNRYTGSVIVQLFGPLDKGNGQLLAYADQVLSIFGNWGGTNIQCRRGYVKDIGPDGQGFYQINVTVPFRRDELF